MIRSAILIVAALVAKVCSVINPGKGFDKPVMMQGDSYVYYMNQVFDVSQAVGIPNFRTSAGQIRTYQTVLNSKQLTAGYAQVEAMEFINNQTFALVLSSWLAFGPSRARYAKVGSVRASRQAAMRPSSA